MTGIPARPGPDDSTKGAAGGDNLLPDAHTATVENIDSATIDVAVLTLRPAGPFSAVPPGSHIDVVVQVGNKSEIRSYSLVDLGHDDGLLRIAVRRDAAGRGGSAWMHERHPGETLRIRGPIDEFAPTPGHRPSVLFAGGIGITPILSLARAIRVAGADYRIIYSGRTLHSMPFAEHLKRAHPGRVGLVETARDGRADLEALVASVPDDGVLYVCGPMGMLASVRAAWQRAEQPPESLRFETFGTSGASFARSFWAEIPSLGIRVEVDPGTSMLDALERAGAEVLYDCLRGECGLCRVRVLGVDGMIDHRDVFLSSRQRIAGDQMCACVSRVDGTQVVIEC